VAKYFHEITDEEFQSLIDRKATWIAISQAYLQPEWCDFPGALEGMFGCMSLVNRVGVNQVFCRTCELYKNESI